tara:strand:+ start:2344 stop:2700 length:357 start_codon:yes stop_codon:yes gene_type:complete
MIIYFTLFAAIGFEVLGTMLLPLSENFTKALPSCIIVVSYCISLYLLSILSQKLPLAILYSTWAGMGIFLVSFFSFYYYNQSLNWQTILGLTMIAIGVSLVNIHKEIPDHNPAQSNPF